MKSIAELYTREMHTRYEYLACWLPSTPLALGDVGILSGHRFRKVTTLTELGISFTREADGAVADLEYSSTDYVSVDSDTRLDAAAADVNLSVSFARDGATLFQASGCVQETIGRLPGLEAALLRAYSGGTWDLRHVVVTEVVRTGPTAIIVSERRGARMTLRLSAASLGGPLPFAGATGSYTVTAKSGIAASVLAPGGATPLFQAAQLRRRLLGEPRLVFRSDEELEDDTPQDEDLPGSHESEELELAAVGWADSGGEDIEQPGS